MAQNPADPYEHSRYYRTRLIPDKTAMRDKLALHAGCASEELIITRINSATRSG